MGPRNQVSDGIEIPLAPRKSFDILALYKSDYYYYYYGKGQCCGLSDPLKSIGRQCSVVAICAAKINNGDSGTAGSWVQCSRLRGDRESWGMHLMLPFPSGNSRSHSFHIIFPFLTRFGNLFPFPSKINKHDANIR